MRHVYLASYDVADPKRWRKVYRLMLGAGDPLHYSVFRCHLSKSEYLLLVEKLLEEIHHHEDRVMFIDLGPISEEIEDRVTHFGMKPLSSPERGAIIV